MKRIYKFSTSKALQKCLTIDQINPGVIAAEYAVRGFMTQKAEEFAKRLEQGEKFPFKSITETNVGNPQIFGQKPLSFNRQVLSAMMLPVDTYNELPFHKDIIEKAKYFQSKIKNCIGAYTTTLGYDFVRQDICNYITKRDNTKDKPNTKNIFLTNGASDGINQIMTVISKDSNTGVMIPHPQYPLYTALISLKGMKDIPYDLVEEEGWQLNEQSLQKNFDDAKKSGINVKALVVINPGNPTGQILNKQTIENVVKFCQRNNILILADEVYQENIYKDNAKFISFRQVISNMPAPYNQVELVSFHSASKGIIGECGIRGGYFELYNIDEDVYNQIWKLKTVFLCANTVGQLTIDLMVNPPSLDLDYSKETVEKDQKERQELLSSLKKRAEIVTDTLNKMSNVKCNEIEGAMYAFPSIFLSQKAIDTAKQQKMYPDLFYCYEALKKTGIVLLPGSGFKQKKNTYHFRTTTLILPESNLYDRFQDLNKFNTWFHSEYK